MDNKLPKGSYNLSLIAVAALLIITPLISTSLKFKYLYFIVNIIIIAIGADAGLLSFLLQSADNKRSPINKVVKNNPDEGIETTHVTAALDNKNSSSDHHDPSIFFIEDTSSLQPGEEEDDGDTGEEELFQKAETFIGNFYKQLKMQREESSIKLH